MSNPALVYIVDDDADVRASLSMLLNSVDINIATYADADSFIKNYCYEPDTPGCLLLDVRMPGLSGMTLLEKLYNGLFQANPTASQFPALMYKGVAFIPIILIRFDRWELVCSTDCCHKAKPLLSARFRMNIGGIQ
jgi:FixJ family two-component response regulator